MTLKLISFLFNLKNRPSNPKVFFDEGYQDYVTYNSHVAGIGRTKKESMAEFKMLHKLFLKTNKRHSEMDEQEADALLERVLNARWSDW